MPKMLFVVRDVDSECGGAFVAESVAEAKKMALREDIAEQFIYLRVRKMKTDVSTWESGLVDYKKCLREGIFGSIEDQCDMCGEEGTLSQVLTDSGKCICSECEEKIYEGK